MSDIVTPLQRALARSTQRSIEQRISPGLLARMVTAGRWSADQALAHIARSQRPEFKSAALACLAESGGDLPVAAMLAQAQSLPAEYQVANVLAALAPHLSADLLPQVLTTIRAFTNSHAVMRAMNALGPHLPEPLLEEALQILRPHARTFPHNAMETIIPLLPEQLLPLALEIAAGIPMARHVPTFPGGKPSAEAHIHPDANQLRLLLPRLPAALMPRVLEIARSYRGGDLLLALAVPHLPEPLIPAAFDIVRAQPDSFTFETLAARLPSDLAGEALGFIPAIASTSRRAKVLAALAPRLPADLLPQALHIAQRIGAAPADADATESAPGSKGAWGWLVSISPFHRPVVKPKPVRLYRGVDPREPNFKERLEREEQQDQAADRVVALAGLVAVLPSVEALAVADEALQTALALDTKLRGRCLIALAPQMPAALLPATLTALEHIEDLDRAVICEILAPHIPETLLLKLIHLLTHTRAGVPRDRALAALAPRLTAKLLAALLAETRKIGEQQLAAVIGGLAPHLPPEQLARSLAAASAIENPHWRASALHGLAAHLPEAAQPQAYLQALRAIKQIDDEGGRFSMLNLFMPHLPATERLHAATAIIRMLPAQSHLDLRWLTPILPEETILDTLATVREHASVYERDEALAALEARLPADQIDRALAASQRIDDANYGATALAILAPHRLNAEQRDLAIAEINSLMDDSLRASVLLGLVPHMSPAQLAGILRWLGLLHTESKAAVLLAVAPHLPANLLRQAMAHAANLRDDGFRTQVVAALAAAHLADATPQILSSFLLVNKQLSLGNLEAILPHVPAARHPALLDLVKTMPDQRLRGKALRILAPHLAADLLPRAVKLANAITDQIGRALALAALAPRLPDAEQQRVLAAAIKAAKAAADDPARMSRARSIEESLNAERDLGWAIIACAPLLSAELFVDAFLVIWSVWEANLRQGLLEAFGRALPTRMAPVVPQVVDAMGDESDRALIITMLAPCLDPDTRAEVRRQAVAISEPDLRRSCLEALARQPQLEYPPRNSHRSVSTPSVDNINALLRTSIETLTNVSTLDIAEQRANVRAIGERLAKIPETSARRLISLWQPVMDAWGECERPDLLSCVTALAPWLVHITTPDDRERIADSILDALSSVP